MFFMIKDGVRITDPIFLLNKLFGHSPNVCTRIVNIKLEPQKISSIKCVVSLRPRTTILYTISLGFMFPLVPVSWFHVFKVGFYIQ